MFPGLQNFPRFLSLPYFLHPSDCASTTCRPYGYAKGKKHVRQIFPAPLTIHKVNFLANVGNGKDSFAEEGTGLLWLLLDFSTTPNNAAI